MSAIIDTNLSLVETSITKLNHISEVSRRRWHKAFATIYSVRAFSHLHYSSHSQNCMKITPESHMIDVVSTSFQNINQSTLVQLVKDKDPSHLAKLGGINVLVSALRTDVDRGLHADDDDILHRQNVFGRNTYTRPPMRSFFSFAVEAMKDPVVLIDLVIGALLSLFFGIKKDGPHGWYEGGSMLLVAFIVTSVSAVSNFKQSRQFTKLSNISDNIQVEVVRNGKNQRISVFDIVVGDVVCLKIGDQVPADGLFLEGHSLQIDESSLTGETEHVEVNHHRNPFLFSGTKLADGYAKLLVTSVGMNTTWGEMMSSISQDSTVETPLQARLKKLTSMVSWIGFAVAFLVHVVLLVKFFNGHPKDGSGKYAYNETKSNAYDLINVILGIIAAAVTIVVAAIPEGLPLAVTLTLVYTMKRMMADQAIVRNLSACETMGSTTTICTDKTGTLTMNKMKVTEFWIGQESMEERNLTSIAKSRTLEFFHQGFCLNTTGSVYKPESGLLEFSGSPTEKAILSWAALELNMDMEELKRSSEVIHVEAFNSEKKRSGILLKNIEDNTMHVHWKGAAEMIVDMCSYYYDSFGNMKILDDTERKKFDQLVQGIAASGLRCIAFAHKQVSEKEHDNGLKDNSLTLLGLVGIKDPCRSGVRKAVLDCRCAGVNVKMITGDNVFTAKAVATECGILELDQDMDGAVVEGVEFRNYTVEERMEKVNKICVMARSSPLDKLLMVQCLKQMGHVVAVTGDGINDAPALKEADIGLAMGIQGTEVAKEGADIIILDDNFESVATVLKWGRCVYINIQKFIQFQLTVNVAALVINFVAAISTEEVPLTVVQLLWVNLIMDTLGALALATEWPTKELMDKRPIERAEPLISNIMWRNLIAEALYQIAVVLTLQFRGEAILNISKNIKGTMIFSTFVLCQVFNEFNARDLEKKNVFEGIHKNKLFLGIIGITIFIQVVMVEFMKSFANTERMNLEQWGTCIGIAAVSWPIAFLVKYIPVPNKPFSTFSTSTT